MALGGVLGLAWARLGRAWRRGILRGRRGTWWYSLSFCVAGVAQTHIYRRFAWQAWDRWHWVARLDWLGRALVARDAAAFCVAGVALGDIHFRSAWQAWHKLTSTVVLRGRRGTDGTVWRAWTGLGAPWSRVTPRHSAWQAWHLVTFTFVLRGRRGTNSLLASFCVAGVGQMALGGVLGLAWARLGRAWRRGILRGRRGTNSHLLSFCVAGMAQTQLYRLFAWQAWDRWHWVARLVWFGRALVARDAAAFCVAGVALGHIHFRFAWQAWHKLTSTVVLRGRRGTDGTGWRAWSGLGAPWSRVTPRQWRRGILRGRRGTWWHSLSFRVAGVVQTHIYCRSAWQAWRKLSSTVVLRGRRGTDGTGWRAGRCLCSNGINIGLLATRKSRRVCRMPVSTLTSFHVLYRFVLEQWPFRWGLVTGVKSAMLCCCWYMRTVLLQLWVLRHVTKDIVIHTYIHTHIHTYIPFYLLDLSPPPLSFLPSPSLLKPLKLILGRSWLVGLSGPLIFIY